MCQKGIDVHYIPVIIVGAGFSGCTIAYKLAEAGVEALLIEKKDHVGGNAFDEFDANGILIHRYGPHIFHTNHKEVFDFLSRFTQWRSYTHKVRAFVDGQLLPIPINRETINLLYGLNLDEAGARQHLEKVRQKKDIILNSEEAFLNSVGLDLYEKFFKGYTQKQWGVTPAELSARVASRIPVRTNTDDRYFTDEYQFMPSEGFTKMFQRMLDHPNIRVELGTDYLKQRDRFEADHVIFTGPIDAYFDYCFGKLPYRSLTFEHENLPGISRYQPVGVVNYPNDYDFTRITEFKHITGQVHSGTSIVREYPSAEGDPYYPVPCPENESLYQRYQALAYKDKTVAFVGRLAEYQYYNMDQITTRALSAADRIIRQFRS